jgi:hypothetical protein
LLEIRFAKATHQITVAKPHEICAIDVDAGSCPVRGQASGEAKQFSSWVHFNISSSEYGEGPHSMTAQIKDKLMYQGQEWSVIHSHGQGLFSPEEHGFTPWARSSACHRGYYCHYLIVRDQLMMQKLWMSLQYPEMVLARNGRGTSLLGAMPQEDKDQGMLVYEWLASPMKFTGGLLVAREEIEIDSYWRRLFSLLKYRTVRDLTFDQGHLIQDEDVSLDVARMREWEIIEIQELEAAQGKISPSREHREHIGWLDKYLPPDLQ